MENNPQDIDEKIHDCAQRIESYFRQNGPTPEQYGSLNRLFARWQQFRETERKQCHDLERSWSRREPVFRTASNIGHAYCKPYGYAGDFELIDRMYRRQISRHPGIRRWDQFFQQQPGSAAIRHRKERFLELIQNLRQERPQGTYVLILGAGPARELLEAFQADPDYRLHGDCVEQDPAAVAYAKKLLGPFSGRVQFLQRNALRFQPPGTYHLVWSAGLFDYFNDQTFVQLLSKATRWLRPGGEIIIGNLSPNNPSRAFMEAFLDWRLYHRTEDQLIKLAHQAGLTREYNLQVEADPHRTSLFLRVMHAEPIATSHPPA